MIMLQFDHVIPAVVLGFFIDLLIGDPRWLYHPVRVIGKLIEALEKFFRGLFPKGKGGERTAGTLTAICVILVSTLVPYFLLRLFYHIALGLGFVFETFWCYQLFATRSLQNESMKVYREVRRGNLEEARDAVSMIVGRDTDTLDFDGITRAAVETVAENTSDGIIAPMFWMMIAGAAGGFFYKSINTLDSMIGYRNEKYQYFGTFAARLDDVVNFIPARLAGILMVAASGMCGLDRRNARRIFLRDRKKHASPNSAHTEAAMAGALRVELAGDASYFGVIHHKPTLGDPIRGIRPDDIRKANVLSFFTALLALIVLTIVRLLVLAIMSLF